MFPSVDDGTAVQNQNPIGPNHRREAMGDHQCGPARHEMIQGILDQGFALCVEARGGLVQDQDRRLPEQDSGDGDPLPSDRH